MLFLSRLAKLAGGVAVLYVGAATEVEMKDAKQNVALFFCEDERTQHHERKGVCV